jgi:UDP-N-acetyl-D-mannosaminuronic acid transferase (WecB/TagA/CpsF family)
MPEGLLSRFRTNRPRGGVICGTADSQEVAMRAMRRRQLWRVMLESTRMARRLRIVTWVADPLVSTVPIRRG